MARHDSGGRSVLGPLQHPLLQAQENMRVLDRIQSSPEVPGAVLTQFFFCLKSQIIPTTENKFIFKLVLYQVHVLQRNFEGIVPDRSI